MSRFLKEQQRTVNPARPSLAEERDVDMESVGSPDRHPSPHEYDPDDLDLDPPRRAAVASATTTTPGRSTSVPRIRVSAMSELKEFAGKRGQDRAKDWPSKVKFTFVRDKASDEVKFLVFGDLLPGSVETGTDSLDARHTVPGRICSAASRFSIVDEGHEVILPRSQEIGRVSGGDQIKDGASEVRREHVERFIESLDDHDLADHLALLRIPDADTLEEALRPRQREKARQSKVVYGSTKPCRKSNNATTPAVKAIWDSSESEAESSGSDSEAGLRRFYLAAAGADERQQDQGQMNRDRNRTEFENSDAQRYRQDTSSPPKRCSHCRSRKHSDLGCWRRLTCEKCDRKGYPSNRCLFTCMACGGVHEEGKCAMGEFYNLIRQWYNPTKHAGMLPETAEKMLN
ncbi:LOW QUALITY PROTEIN: hypothetical protein PHPALM_30502 [Phytophthora palmivora]|uniref:Uncharacterized protein n=1 Tax=Phytophthora palmivora TaxID=4796 RepID=A0A2P4X534_9STRA|nr:LOW QUALITY PROTEIN: hypothetical protein PHPALM_30502 [Phytophthora palmivora]